MIVPVVLSGGTGTRLWPLSRSRQPKQLLALVDKRTMLRATFDRVSGLDRVTDPLVVCNADHHELVSSELLAAGGDPTRVILEPVGRNTAPAALAAAIALLEGGEDATMLVLPADHIIRDEDAFRSAVEVAVRHAEEGRLVTFGIVPHYPETGYGYIRAGAAITRGSSEILEFVEKPDREQAEGYLREGGYLWNSGMFVFGARRYLDELERLQPSMVEAVGAALNAADRTGAIHLDPDRFANAPSDSIDYAVMEHTGDGAVVSLDAGWSDVGSWAALWEVSDQDAQGNVLVGDVAVFDSKRSYLRSEGRLLAAVGVEDMVVVETADAVLVAPLEKAQDVRMVVDELSDHTRVEADQHTARPTAFGSVEDLDHDPAARVRRLRVSPGNRFSGTGRETDSAWVIVSGTGRVAVGPAAKLVGPGDTITIPRGMEYEAGNDGVADLEIIDVQIGPSAADRGDDPSPVGNE